MEVSILESFIKPDSMIMIPDLYLLGLFLDRTPKVPPWVTTWVQVFIGIIFCVAYYGLIIQAVVQGILVAGSAVLIKDFIQKSPTMIKKEQKDDPKE